MNKKGIYSIFSAFMLIIVIIATLLFLLYMGLSSETEARIVANQTRILQESNLIKNEIIYCWKEINFEDLAARELGVNENKCVPEMIPGYEIKIFDLLGCVEKDYFFGNVSNCSKKTSYFINVFANDGQKCLGQLLICFGV